MFQVQLALVSDDVAHARFACKTSACKGACCVVGEAGAPVAQKEVPVLKKAYKLLKDELRPQAVEVVEQNGLIVKNQEGLELACVNDGECVFVVYEADVAVCAIQRAYFAGHFHWEKPLSCHLFPIRISTIGAIDYVNFEFVPEICTPGAVHGKTTGLYLAEFLQTPLVRKFGREWYDEFLATCQYIREHYSPR
jgi:hypothetical protein